MSKLSPVPFLNYVVRPALGAMGRPYHTVAAEQLLVGMAEQPKPSKSSWIGRMDI